MYDGKKASLFDLLEDLDYDDCLAKAQAIAGVKGSRPSGKMQAFVFVKPHAVTDKAKALAKSSFVKAGITVYKEGKLTGDVIEKDKLIDNHYYAIANKVRSPARPPNLDTWPESGHVARGKRKGWWTEVGGRPPGSDGQGVMHRV